MDSLSLVGGSLFGSGVLFAWPVALCRNAGRKRAHRLGALSTGLVAAPKGSPGEGSNCPGDSSIKSIDHSKSCPEGTER